MTKRRTGQRAPKPRNPEKRRFEKALKFFTLAIVPHDEFQVIYSKVGPDFKIPDATKSVHKESLQDWHLYLGKCKELEQYLNQLFSTGMPIYINTTIRTEDECNYQIVNFKYEKITGYDGMRVRVLLNQY